MPIQQMLLGTSSGGLTKGEWYPMWAFKNSDQANSSGNISPPTSAHGSFGKMEEPVRRCLSFDTTNTTELNGTETISEIITILDAASNNRYTCNSAFASGGKNIDGLKIKHVDSSGSIYNIAYCLFNGSAFNIYDHACNAATNLNYGLPSQMGSVTEAKISTSGGGGYYTVANTNVYVNSSSHDIRTGTADWASDGGDYCFLGISDKHHTSASSDSFDGAGFATSNGLAFGISDSDGTPSNSQPPRTGITRRTTYYSSLMSNKMEAGGTNIGHCGDCVIGYFIVEGRVK